MYAREIIILICTNRACFLGPCQFVSVCVLTGPLQFPFAGSSIIWMSPSQWFWIQQFIELDWHDAVGCYSGGYWTAQNELSYWLNQSLFLNHRSVVHSADRGKILYLTLSDSWVTYIESNWPVVFLILLTRRWPYWDYPHVCKLVGCSLLPLICLVIKCLIQFDCFLVK